MKRVSESSENGNSVSSDDPNDNYKAMNDTEAAALLTSLCGNNGLSQEHSADNISGMSKFKVTTITNFQTFTRVAFALVPLPNDHNGYKADDSQNLMNTTENSYVLIDMKPELETEPPHSCCSEKNIIAASAASANICKCEPGLCQKDGTCCPGCPGSELMICSKSEPSYYADTNQVQQVPNSYNLVSTSVHETPPSLVHCS